ncbi:MAG: 4-(cytidine 5'-diphospho)-2-C-methyl-D-erythritol kinase, partial [Bacteroidales bacterium]|nr:4-(cytidine 5'-diphospho)-2-C-methyl-D-erythritol kinase [Bacteroidales bacterium]
FFIRNIPQWGSGKGEILTPAEIDLSGYDIRIAIPEGVHVSTAEAYGGITPALPAIPLKEALKLPVSEWRGKVVNDFEASVFPKRPEIAALKERFYADGAVYASMTGSGAAVFGLF